MSRTFRNRAGWFTSNQWNSQWNNRRDKHRFFTDYNCQDICCSQKAERMMFGDRDKRMKPSDAKRAARN